MKKLDYENIKITPKSRDSGKDIIMTFRNFPVVVECKHQKFVGRPIIQKLHSAMLHEKMNRNSDFVKGIIVTSGKFSDEAIQYNKEINQNYSKELEIELIDGKKLKNLCIEKDIILLNGKIQIKTDNVVQYINEKEVSKEIYKDYKKVVGAKEEFIKNISCKLELFPAYYIEYEINSEIATSVGTIYSIHKHNQKFVIDGLNGKELDEDKKDFYFNTSLQLEEIDKKEKEINEFEFTENDIEDIAINEIIKKYAKEVTYIGNNNVTYTHHCEPKKYDIYITKANPLYLPSYNNEIEILKQKYHQKVFDNKNNLLFEQDELHECKICKREINENRYLCPLCGKILCNLHKKIDNYDKKTPVCESDAIKKVFWIQPKYFVYSETAKKYKEKWEKMNFFQKIVEDKYALTIAISSIVGIVILFANIL
jgi:hypothetical protein